MSSRLRQSYATIWGIIFFTSSKYRRRRVARLRRQRRFGDRVRNSRRRRWRLPLAKNQYAVVYTQRKAHTMRHTNLADVPRAARPKVYIFTFLTLPCAHPLRCLYPSPIIHLRPSDGRAEVTDTRDRPATGRTRKGACGSGGDNSSHAPVVFVTSATMTITFIIHLICEKDNFLILF